MHANPHAALVSRLYEIFSPSNAEFAQVHKCTHYMSAGPCYTLVPSTLVGNDLHSTGITLNTGLVSRVASAAELKTSGSTQGHQRKFEPRGANLGTSLNHNEA